MTSSRAWIPFWVFFFFFSRLLAKTLCTHPPISGVTCNEIDEGCGTIEAIVFSGRREDCDSRRLGHLVALGSYCSVAQQTGRTRLSESLARLYTQQVNKVSI